MAFLRIFRVSIKSLISKVTIANANRTSRMSPGLVKEQEIENRVTGSFLEYLVFDQQ